VYLDGGKVETGKMTKERADKLVAAGIVGCQGPTSSHHLISSPPGHPGHPCCAPYSHRTHPAGAVGASLAPGQGAADGDDDPHQNSSSGLPKGWMQHHDSISGRPCYFQEATRQTSEKPINPNLPHSG